MKLQIDRIESPLGSILVWQGLRSIPVGRTLSYGELATKLGKPTAARAVGMANSLNPLA